MANKIIWGSDLYKGFKLPKNHMLGGAIDDILPFQMLSMEDKTIDWIQAVADYYEVCGWNNVEKRAPKIQRNYWMRTGKLNQSDYIINPEVNPYHKAVAMVLPPESSSPLEQFYPLAPNFVDILRGEFTKRDNRWTIETIDPYSMSEVFENKRKQFEEILTQNVQLQKQQTLAELGITEEVDPEQYAQQMQSMMKQFTEVELKSKNFRTTGSKWAEKVLKIHEKRYNLQELEPDGFESGLITDSEFWHIDMGEDDFKIDLLNSMWCDYHKGPNVKYVSDGDYFLWFDFMSAGDVINKLGRKMKEEDILKLKDCYVRTSNLLVPDYLKGRQGEYYDTRKSWSEATDLNPAMNDSLLGKELAYNYMRSPNFEHNIDVDILSPNWGKSVTGHPQMFRVMRLYWRSLKKIGWLTKINRDGSMDEPSWIDENYKVTIEPEYDQSVVKEKTKKNLIYGEHIDWTWVNDWRHVIKISPNQKHTFWLNDKNRFESIYLDGGPVPFQFKGRNNPFESLPPVEGCNFSYINTTPHSFIDRLRPIQILYNICMNKIPKKFLGDHGNKVAIDRRMIENNNTSNSTKRIDPVEEFEDRLRDSDVLAYKVTRESLEGLGNPGLPTVLQLSTISEADAYLTLSQKIKWEAGELIGISRQRSGNSKASETAYSVEQGINYSETQTEKYFEQHSNLMQRFRQRMLDAAQYYSTFHESNRDVYMNEMDETVMLEMEGLDNLLPHYNIYLQSRANVKAALQTITQFLREENTLPIAPSAKIEALVENSIPKILNLIRTSELEQIQRDIAEQDAQRAAEQQKMEMQQKMQSELLARQDQQKELDRQKDIDVATIRALGGVQTDNNADKIPDAQQNLDNYFRQQDILDKRKTAQDNINSKKLTDTEKMLVEREKIGADLEKERIKQKGALAVAKENRTAAEIKGRKK